MLKRLIKKIIPYKMYYPILSSYRKISSKKYHGKDFLCPFCETEFTTCFKLIF